MEARDPDRRRRPAGPVSICLLVAAVVVLLVYLRPSTDAPEPPDRDRSGPSGPVTEPDPEEDRILARIRESLGNDPDAVAALAARLPGPEEVVGFLARTRPELDLAIRSGEPEAAVPALELLARALRANPGEVRPLLFSAAFAPVWQRGAEADSPEVRAAAARLIGAFGTERARVLAVPLLADPSPAVRAAAVRAYAATATPAGAGRLAALFGDEPETAVRVEIVRALGRNPRLKTPAAAEVVRSALGDDAAVALEALEWVSLYRERGLLPDVRALLASDAASVRREAVRTLGILGDPRVLPELRALLSTEEDPGVRAALTEAVDGLSR